MTASASASLSFPFFFLLLILTNTISAAKVTNPKNPPKNAILLSKVESLTFRANKQTTARRVSPIPQLNCVGPASVCSLYPIDVMRCTNEGADYESENIQWACKASLPEEFKLGSTEVMCEGYASSEDSFVLKGSCGVEYRLMLTEKGEEKYGRPEDDSPWGDDNTKQSLLARVVFFAIFGGVLFVIISRLLAACRRNPPRLGGNNGRGGGGPWFGGGGDGGGGSDDPPPYDSHRFDSPRKTQRSYGSTDSSAGPSRQGQQQNPNQGWRPGPWTAGLAGAGLGYALGRNQGQRETRQPPQRPGGGLFGGGGSSYRDSGGPSRPAAASPSVSSSRYESTGFGGTSRSARDEAETGAPGSRLKFSDRQGKKLGFSGGSGHHQSSCKQYGALQIFST